MMLEDMVFDSLKHSHAEDYTVDERSFKRKATESSPLNSPLIPYPYIFHSNYKAWRHHCKTGKDKVHFWA
jgi:hypothetical protein